jgi:hypothetical protein
VSEWFWLRAWRARQVDCADLLLSCVLGDKKNLDPVERRCSGKPPRLKQMTLARNKIAAIQDLFISMSLITVRLFPDHSYIIVSISIISLCMISFSFPTCNRQGQLIVTCSGTLNSVST